MYDRARIFEFFASLQQSSEIFDNVRLAFGTTLENLRKSSESGRISSENRQKRSHPSLGMSI